MVGIMTESVGKAMAKQVKRVNSDPKALQQRLDEQAGVIQVQKDEIIRLRNLLNKAGVKIETVTIEAEYISASEFARRHHVAVSSITRKFAAGKLPGRQNDKGYILIRADAVYTKRQRKTN